MLTSHDARTPPLQALVLVALLYFAGAKAAVVLTTMPEGMAILWPSNGILLAAFIWTRGRRWLPLMCLIIAAEVAADWSAFTIVEALLFGLVNVGEAALTYRLLTRWQFNPAFARLTDLAKFVIAGPVVSSFAAACLGALVYSVFRGGTTPYPEFLRIWWFGDALGLMIVTPLLLAYSSQPAHDPPSTAALSVHDGLAVAGGLIAVALLIASRGGSLFGIHFGPVLLLPFVIFLAARFAFRMVAWIVLATALIVMVLTTSGRNPFGHLTPREAVIHAQEFIFIVGVVALGLAALLSQLRASHGALELANIELTRRAAELEHANVNLLRTEAEIAALNESLERRVRERTRELEAASAQVKRLQGLLPICAWCKRIRDHNDDWCSVEEYIAHRTDAKFSHGICPDCLASEGF